MRKFDNPQLIYGRLQILILTTSYPTKLGASVFQWPSRAGIWYIDVGLAG